MDSNKLKYIPTKSGVYQMYDSRGLLLYVGKAKNLRNRVSSYFRGGGLNNKTIALVQRIDTIEVTVTATEKEALLLEHNMIKQSRPLFNVLLRDDKTYPYVKLSQHKFPRLSVYRTKSTASQKNAVLFGPYPNAYSAKVAVELMFKVFKVRSCSDSVFLNRSRPCLQYQINRCSAPCVDYINPQEYARDIDRVVDFLDRKDEKVITDLAVDMEQSAEQLQYEKAAQIRDKIGILREFLSTQHIRIGSGDFDVLAIVSKPPHTCISLLFIRNGSVVANKQHIFYNKIVRRDAEIIAEFIGQYYLQEQQIEIPRTIVLPFEIKNMSVFAEAISEVRRSKVEIKVAVRSRLLQWKSMAYASAEQNIQLQHEQRDYQVLFTELGQLLAVPNVIDTIECFDISHTFGTLTVASCVVFDISGASTNNYRRYNLENMRSDDYLAMKTVMQKRYQKKRKLQQKMPSLILVDGGKGQLGIAEQLFNDLGIDDVILLGIAKGLNRKSGLEKIFKSPNNQSVKMDSMSPVFHMLQHIRDEAHRFAITGHRNRRNKNSVQSPLLSIEGIGHQKRKLLLERFGGLQQIQSASIEDLTRVSGINKNIAEKVYKFFHN